MAEPKEPPYGLEYLTHKRGALVCDNLLGDAHLAKHLVQLVGDCLGSNVMERNGLGIPGGIVHQDQKKLVSGGELDEGPHYICANYLKQDRYQWHRV